MLRLNQSLARFIRKVHCVLQVEQQKFILASLNLNKKKVLNFTFRNKLLEILCFHELKLSKQSCLIVTVLRENENKGLIFSFFCYPMMRYRKECNSNNNTPNWKPITEDIPLLFGCNWSRSCTNQMTTPTLKCLLIITRSSSTTLQLINSTTVWNYSLQQSKSTVVTCPHLALIPHRNNIEDVSLFMTLQLNNSRSRSVS